MNRAPAKIVLSLGALGVMAGAVLGAAPARAAGTLAGTEITNSAQLNYTVSSVAQTAVVSTDKVTVDRVVRYTATTLTAQPVTVTPNSTGVVAAYSLTSTSNASVSFGLTGSGTAGDTFSLTNEKFYWDSNSNAAYDPGTDKEITPSNSPVVAPDTSLRFFSVAAIPATATHGQQHTTLIRLVAIEPNITGTEAMPIITATSGANTTGVDTVLSDAGSTYGDAVNNGAVHVASLFTVAAPVLTVARTVRLIEDPVNGTTNPKAIPGAILEYCVAVSNAPSAATATDVALADTFDPGVTPISGSIWIDGTVTNGICNTDGYNSGAMSDTQVMTFVSSLAPGETAALLYRARVK